MHCHTTPLLRHSTTPLSRIALLFPVHNRGYQPSQDKYSDYHKTDSSEVILQDSDRGPEPAPVEIQLVFHQAD